MSTEQRKLLFDNGEILEYILDRSKRKNIYISIKDNKVILKLPFYANIKKGEDFIKTKKDWILKNLNSVKSVCDMPLKYADGESFVLAGEKYIISAEFSEKYFMPYFENGKLIISVNDKNQKHDEKYIHKQAEKAVNKRISEIIFCEFEKITKLTGLYPEKVTIKKMKSSWGRCSSNRNISINSKICFYDIECIDYVIIHELCHLVHMNHSKNFWTLVEKYCPERKQIQKRIK